MTSGKNGPTLTDAKGMGGIMSQSGFDYQLWDGLARVPAWLRNPAFEGLIFEGLEDLEARFFAPHAPRKYLLDRFQAKSGVPTRSELLKVFKSFATFEAVHPQVARVQTLVVPGLPPTLEWIARNPGRVRRARPFYEPFSDIRAASDDKLREDLARELDPDLGEFLADYVEIDVRTFPDRQSAEAVFGSAMHEAFPHLDVGARKMAAAFAALSDVAAQSRGVMVTRACLAEVLDETLGVALLPEPHLRLHIRSDRTGALPDALEIDASAFSGAGAVFPDAERWRAELLDPLDTTASWARAHDHQRVRLCGSYRLSTGFAIGWSFRSATGFEIEMSTRSDLWATDNRPPPGATSLPWQIKDAKSLAGARLLVAVGILRDPTPDVLVSLGLPGEDSVVAAFLPQPLADGFEAQVYIQAVKNAVSAAVGSLGPKQIDLFVVGPAAFAVALGHRWNALPPTQFHEFLPTERRYTPTIRVV